MNLLYDVLSLWEIAHRWHNEDPNITDPKAPPLKVQDTLRFLTRSMARHELRLCSENGVEYDNDNDITSKHDYFENFTPKRASRAKKEDSWDKYYEWHLKRIKRHCDAVEDFDKCYTHRIYDKEKLDSTYTPKHTLAELCHNRNIPLPEFWYSMDEEYQSPAPTVEKSVTEIPVTGNSATEGAVTGTPAPLAPVTENAVTDAPSKLRRYQLDRIACQAIARTLWDADNEMNIVQVTSHRAIRIYGNGAHYKPDTLRDWVKEYDPRPDGKRGGRPRKKTEE